MAERRPRSYLLPAIGLSAIAGFAFAGGFLTRRADVRGTVVAESAHPAANPEPASRDDVAPRPSVPPVPDAPATQQAPVEPAPEPEREPLHILVSIDSRRLWLVDGQDTLLRAQVAIGMAKDFTYGGRRYHFATPRGRRTVIGKERDPLWIPPEWHYYEKAAKLGIEKVVRLDDNDWIVLGDSSYLVVQDGQVGRINHFGNFAPFTPGTEIIFDGTMYIPPPSTAQRKVPNALGPYKLDMGDGYLIHGTHLYNEDSIGDAVSHGCVRMRNEDLIRLYPLVPRGTPVVIF